MELYDILESPASPLLNELPAINWNSGDKHGHLTLESGHVLANRYEVIRVLGNGSFGKVYKVRDTISELQFAMKVSLRVATELHFNMIVSSTWKDSINDGYNSSKKEIDYLRKLNQLDPKKKELLVRLFDTFETGGRIFQIFELLSSSIFDFLGSNNFQPFPIQQVQHISYQIICAIAFLHKHNIVHTDIKPENVLFVYGDYTEVENVMENNGKIEALTTKWPTRRILKRTNIRIIDFGSSIFINNKEKPRFGKITTREYRCPESILKLGWGLPADIWSIGCTIFDVMFGFTLFQDVKSDDTHLSRMEILLGPIPSKYLKKAPKEFLAQRSAKSPRNNRRWETSTLHPSANPWITRLINYFDPFNSTHTKMYDLLTQMLKYKSKKRITASSALSHKAFESLPEYFKFDHS